MSMLFRVIVLWIIFLLLAVFKLPTVSPSSLVTPECPDSVAPLHFDDYPDYPDYLRHGAELVVVQREPLQLGQTWGGPARVTLFISDKVVIKQCFVELEINSWGREAACVGDNCIIYGIGGLRVPQMVTSLTKPP